MFFFFLWCQTVFWRTHPRTLATTFSRAYTSLHPRPPLASLFVNALHRLRRPIPEFDGRDHQQRMKKIRAHRGIINAFDRTTDRGVEGEGGKQSRAVWEVGYPVTGVCWSADGQHVYVSALENGIHVARMKKYTRSGDTPTLTFSLARSPHGSFFLSRSFTPPDLHP